MPPINQRDKLGDYNTKIFFAPNITSTTHILSVFIDLLEPQMADEFAGTNRSIFSIQFGIEEARTGHPIGIEELPKLCQRRMIRA